MAIHIKLLCGQCFKLAWKSRRQYLFSNSSVNLAFKWVQVVSRSFKQAQQVSIVLCMRPMQSDGTLYCQGRCSLFHSGGGSICCIGFFTFSIYLQIKFYNSNFSILLDCVKPGVKRVQVKDEWVSRPGVWRAATERQSQVSGHADIIYVKAFILLFSHPLICWMTP